MTDDITKIATDFSFAFEDEDKEKVLNEMAHVGDINNELELWIRTNDPGHIPHFHIWDKNTDGNLFHTCLKLEIPEYFHHTGKEDVLNAHQRRDLMDFLKAEPKNSKFTNFKTNWEKVVFQWNENNSKHTVDDEMPMPDYSKITENKSK